MTRERLMLLLSPIFALSALIWALFGRLSIPLLTAPSLTLIGGVVLLSTILGAVPALMMPGKDARRWREVAFVVTLAAISLVVLDISAGGHDLLSGVASNRAGRLGVLVLFGMLLIVTLWVVRRRAGALFFAASAVFFASTVALNLSVFASTSNPTPITSSVAATPDKPPLVYILLDSGMGVEGLRVAPEGEALADDLRALFERHRFRLHGGAFSRHFISARSIPNALNFDFRDNSWGPILRHATGLKVRSLLFEKLAMDGYEVVTYGTKHVDFCFAVAARCEVFPSFNPFSSYIATDQIQLASLLQITWSALSGSYLVYQSSGVLFPFLSANGWPPGLTFVDTYGFPRWFDRFAADVATSPRGRAYFAHMLVPHSPFVFDAECEPTGKAVVADYLSEERHLSGAALEEARIAGYRGYHVQYRCVMKALDALLSRLDQLPQFDDATIIIHGDHGARISAGRFAETVSDRDMIDNHSSLFAIRRPHVDPGYDTRKTSVQRLMAEYFSPQGTDLGADDLTVAIDSVDGASVVIRPMPDFGLAK